MPRFIFVYRYVTLNKYWLLNITARYNIYFTSVVLNLILFNQCRLSGYVPSLKITDRLQLIYVISLYVKSSPLNSSARYSTKGSDKGLYRLLHVVVAEFGE